jgi:hypothetical protein
MVAMDYSRNPSRRTRLSQIRMNCSENAAHSAIVTTLYDLFFIDSRRERSMNVFYFV